MFLRLMNKKTKRKLSISFPELGCLKTALLGHFFVVTFTVLVKYVAMMRQTVYLLRTAQLVPPHIFAIQKRKKTTAYANLSLDFVYT